jgi:putative transposase
MLQVMPWSTNKRRPLLANHAAVDRTHPEKYQRGLDFMRNALQYSKPFRTLNVIQESNRDILAVEIDTSLLGE